ncbi:CoA transferase [Nocardia sp. NPDC005366]|uniref:CaiB/BaiF CoA transferase family protein n=1 Tax=Nocardia sp. NPDC005366 TaxID=3156878 RepID=UPI0033AF6D8A
MIKLLEGVRVVECAVLFNGDQTGRLLADLGADVIKVEAPGVGDYLRDFLGQIVPHHSPAHMFVNRNKRSMTLNLKAEEGREVFFDLLKTADIFIDGFAGDACAQLGIGYEQQKAVKPDIVYAQCSGFGAFGPLSNIPTHGQMMGSLGGGAKLSVGDDGLVQEHGGLTDGTVPGALFTALSAVAALEQVRRTGEGVYIDGAGSDAVLGTQWIDALYHWNASRLVGGTGLGGGESNPKYHFYETKDERFVLFCAIEPKFWRNFCRAVERDDLSGTVDTATPVDFGGSDELLTQELARIFRERTQAEWVEIARVHDIAMGPANQVGDLRDDPQLRARGSIHDSVHPVAGPFTAPGWPAMVSGQPFDVIKPAPLLGEHTDEVLVALGYDAENIATLRAAGAF